MHCSFQGMRSARFPWCYTLRIPGTNGQRSLTYCMPDKLSSWHSLYSFAIFSASCESAMAYILTLKSPCWWYHAWVQHSCLCYHHQHAHYFSCKHFIIFYFLRNTYLFSLSTLLCSKLLFSSHNVLVFKNPPSRSEANGTVIVQLSWRIKWSWPISLPQFPPNDLVAAALCWGHSVCSVHSFNHMVEL